jgi:thiamine pyrophosphokinase
MEVPLRTTVSVVPLSAGTVASERGMRWELDHEPLGLLDDRGVSNRTTADVATVTCHEGTLAVFVVGDAAHDEDLW